MDEHGYIRSVHRKLPPDLYSWKINDSYQGGVADAFYRGSKKILFAEYKYIKEANLPVRDSTLIIPDCSALQLDWLKGSYNDGVPTVVIVGTPKGGLIFTHSSWVDGIPKGIISEYLLSQTEIARIIYSHCTTENIHVNNEQKCFSNNRQT